MINHHFGDQQPFVYAGSHGFDLAGAVLTAQVVQYVWKKWSDNGAISHFVAPTSNKTYTATFQTQYFLTMSAGAGGTVQPASGWHNAGSSVVIKAKANPGFTFAAWAGTGTGSYTGTNNPGSIIMGGPISEMGNFSP